MGMAYQFNAGQLPGHSTTVTRYLGTALRKMTPRKCYLLTDTTIAVHASNGWTFDVQAAGVSILTTAGQYSTLTANDGALTAGTAASLAADTTKTVAAGAALTLVMTIAASGVDQSNSRFAVTIEFED